jgi:hypothetical protein
MGTNVRQGIVTNGLTLHLDIANPLCYPGSGTSVTSLLRNGVTGSISGSNISYSTATGNKAIFINNPGFGVTSGNITLNSDPFNVGNNPFTIEVVWYIISYNTSGRVTLANNILNGTAVAGYFMMNINGSASPVPGFQVCRVVDGAGIFTANQVNVGQWNHVCVTVARGAGNTSTLYFNGSPTRVAGDPGNIANTSGTSAITRANSSGPLGGANGHMAITRFYNRALSAAEVLQNYNALKTRFGLS